MANSTQLQRSNFPFCGRLIVLESDRTSGYDPFAGLSSFLSINFPSMPDSVELSRSVDYLVNNSQVMPDGLHQYKYTNPLSIPFSFKLHSYDREYCPQGALSLLQLAALLHSFALPLSGNGENTAPIPVTRAQKQQDTAQNGDQASLLQRSQALDNPYTVTPETGSDFFPPVTLRLELIFVDETSPGIACTGYVKDVRARLLGPWLRGPGSAQNLPSAGEFEFTFVHVPGYGNNFSITTDPTAPDSSQAQVFAEDAKARLYNSSQLTRISNRTYRGLSH